MALTKAKLIELIENGDIDVGGGGLSNPMPDDTLIVNLNADKLDGYHATAFAQASHSHNNVKLIYKATSEVNTLRNAMNSWGIARTEHTFMVFVRGVDVPEEFWFGVVKYTHGVSGSVVSTAIVRNIISITPNTYGSLPTSSGSSSAYEYFISLMG